MELYVLMAFLVKASGGRVSWLSKPTIAILCSQRISSHGEYLILCQYMEQQFYSFVILEMP